MTIKYFKVNIIRAYSLKNYALFIFLFLSSTLFAQELPADKVVQADELATYLKEDIKELLTKDGAITEDVLASYLRDKFSERYYYDWKSFDKRFNSYKENYSGNQKDHAANAKDHMSKYSDSTQWVLPFNYLNGEPVNAYALRHLARQHKMVDIGFQYHYEDKDPAYITYFVRQIMSLNVALEKGEYEKIEDGNGVYEVYRSGYRALNWFHVHNMFLGQPEYKDEDQLLTIATLLQQGAHLYRDNPKFRDGNHQTKGMSALAMISILLRDFEGTDLWLEHSMKILEEHLSKEINEDGFQFERTVHYHMADIINFFYPYQLAKISNIEVDNFWEEKLYSLFSTLTKIAYPDKSAPVLQDDTNRGWAEKNDISGALTMGYLLFEDPVFGYFADDNVDGKMHWYLSDKQLSLLGNVKKDKPDFYSLALPVTGYYVMREGWDKRDKMMIISAGLDDKKPDHQHGDMLGIQAMANGKIILPNYQVRYALKDLELFKNSMVKNVALVDDELQGKEYTSNQGGSGFGKFKKLPDPKTIIWKSNKNFDLFVGSHNGFNNIDVEYSRQVIYLKDDFWIVKDNFHSENSHAYKQIWQGHYTEELSPNLIRSSFDDGSGCDIFQLRNVDNTTSSGTRGKEWTVVSKTEDESFSFVTVIQPFEKYSDRINEEDENPDLKGWSLNNSPWKIDGTEPVSISENGESYLFGVENININQVSINLNIESDLYIKLKDENIYIILLGDAPVELSIKGVEANKLNGTSVKNKMMLTPGDELIGKLK